MSAEPQRDKRNISDMTDLKLLALDTEDLEVISAHVQDAVVRVGDIAYVSGKKQFVLLMNRFAWEDGISNGKSPGTRKRAMLHFDRVLAARFSGIDMKAEEGVLELLSVSFTPGTDEPAGTIELSFAGGGTVLLDAECIEARLKDLGAAWGAKAKPVHALDENA